MKTKQHISQTTTTHAPSRLYGRMGLALAMPPSRRGDDGATQGDAGTADQPYRPFATGAPAACPLAYEEDEDDMDEDDNAFGGDEGEAGGDEEEGLDDDDEDFLDDEDDDDLDDEGGTGGDDDDEDDDDL